MASGKVDKFLRIKSITVTSATPVNVNVASGRIVNNGNFLSAVPLDAQVIALPYFNASIQYLALKNLDLSTAAGEKRIRVYYLE